MKHLTIIVSKSNENKFISYFKSKPHHTFYLYENQLGLSNYTGMVERQIKNDKPITAIIVWDIDKHHDISKIVHLLNESNYDSFIITISNINLFTAATNISTPVHIEIYHHTDSAKL